MSETSSTNIVYVKYFLIGNIDTNITITEYSTNALGSKEKKNANQPKKINIIFLYLNQILFL